MRTVCWLRSARRARCLADDPRLGPGPADCNAVIVVAVGPWDHESFDVVPQQRKSPKYVVTQPGSRHLVNATRGSAAPVAPSAPPRGRRRDFGLGCERSARGVHARLETAKSLLQSSRRHVQLTFDLAQFAGDLVVFVGVGCQFAQPHQQIFEGKGNRPEGAGVERHRNSWYEVEIGRTTSRRARYRLSLAGTRQAACQRLTGASC